MERFKSIFRVYLLGFGIGYSESPAINQNAFRRVGYPIRYQLCDVSPAQFETKFEALIRRPSTLGFNVTIPYKERVVEFCHRLSPSARRFCSVNTIAVSADGSLAGHCTDLPALRESLQSLLAHSSPERVVILGAGALSRIAARVLLEHGAKRIEVWSRSTGRIAKFKECLGERMELVFNLLDDLRGNLGSRVSVMPGSSPGADLLVNATPIGRGGKLPIEIRRLLDRNAPAYVFDANYRVGGILTGFEKWAGEQGAKVIEGSRMLRIQARLSRAIWYRRLGR